MATDVDVQYFSHLNGLTLGNNWGDLIRLLDKALVTGIDFTQITSASIDAQGDVHITLYAAHNAMLFQVVELSGFTPSSLNQKYRIKGVPNTTQLILKPQNEIAERTVTTVGTGKLASLGYDIIFRDTNDVKRVYRAKNPTTQHPYIRVDETISDGVNSYSSTYAKYAMVGLLEHMDHIDDYINIDVLQLPLDPVDPAKNWKITGAGPSVVRGWSRWYWARSGNFTQNVSDSEAAEQQNRAFTIIGNHNSFYLLNSSTAQDVGKSLKGCGLLNSSNDSKEWFLMSTLVNYSADTIFVIPKQSGGNPLSGRSDGASFNITRVNSILEKQHTICFPLVIDYNTGHSDVFSATRPAALEIPVYDELKNLRGSLQHVCYAGNKNNETTTTPMSGGLSMYVWDKCIRTTESISEAEAGGLYFYLGDLE